MSEDAWTTGTERAVLGEERLCAVDAWLSRVLEQLIGSATAEVLFRSGRVDAVYGLRSTDGRRLLLKVHRPPVDLGTRRAVSAAQLLLADAGFPCARPVAEVTRIDGHVVSLETLLDDGERGDAHDPGVRASIAAGLAEQLHLLAGRPAFLEAGRAVPAWCAYQDGPWPTPHDTFFDFATIPAEWAWVDDLAGRAADQILASVDAADERAVSHADWYCGNLRFDGARVAACFDWDLVTDTVPVLAGLTAGFHSHGSVAGADQAEPGEMATFLQNFEDAYGTRFDARGQRAAAGAAAWSVAYAARCQVQMLDGEPEPGSPLQAFQQYGAEYAALRW